MDYSDDACMNIFTQDQKARVDAVLLNSPRRVELLSSNACSGDVADCQAPYPQATDLSSTTVANGIQLSWTPIEGSIGCQIRAGLSSVGFQTTVTVFEANASEFFVPASAIQSGVEYQWQVRCGCSANPLVVGPWSSTDFFSFGSAISDDLFSDNNSDQEMVLYPNPATDILTVSSIKVDVLHVFDVNGRVIHSQSINMEEKGSIRLDVSSWSNGLYLMSVSNKDGSVTRRTFVVN